MLQTICNYFTYSILSLDSGSALATSVNFFIYSFIEILFLMFTVISIISFLRSFFPADKIKAVLSKMRFGSGNLLASLFGAVTPFCSCSSIPIFIGFIEAKIPLGIAFSFLITSPLVNEVAFVIMGGLFGWKIAIIYSLLGILLGVIGGLIIGFLNQEKEIIIDTSTEKKIMNNFPSDIEGKIKFSLRIGYRTVKKLFPYVTGGLLVGAVIHGYVPADFFMQYVGQYKLLSVPLAVLLGIPVYAGCSTVVPVVFSLTAAGLPLGTSLAFIMAVAGLSLPEAIMLKRIMTIKLLAIFFGLVALGIIIIGYSLNLIY